GHQQSLIPATSRSSPARDPRKEVVGFGGGPSVAGGAFAPAGGRQPTRPPARRSDAQHPVRDMAALPGDPTGRHGRRSDPLTHTRRSRVTLMRSPFRTAP